MHLSAEQNKHSAIKVESARKVRAVLCCSRHCFCLLASVRQANFCYISGKKKKDGKKEEEKRPNEKSNCARVSNYSQKPSSALRYEGDIQHEHVRVKLRSVGVEMSAEQAAVFHEKSRKRRRCRRRPPTATDLIIIMTGGGGGSQSK